MPDYRSYGEILRYERERAGIDLATMSKRLHIRPDILGAIESSDFSRMPARGYAKSMVRAYARALGLDEQLITDMYLDEVHLFEVGSPRNVSPSRASSQGRRPTQRAESTRARSQSVRFSSRSQATRPQATRPQAGRASDDQTRRRTNAPAPALGSRNSSSGAGANRAQNRGQGSSRTRERSSRGAQGGGVGAAFGSLVSSLGQRKSSQTTRVGRSYETIGSTPPYARTSSSRRGEGFIAGLRLPILLAIIALIIVLIIVAVVVVNGGRQSSEDVPDIPISGLTDTSSPEDQNQVSQVDVAPQSIQVAFSVESGQDAWMEVYQNGSETPDFAEVVSGPKTETYTVTGTLTIRTANPDAVTVTVDNETVQLTKESDSSYYSYTADFEEVLTQWQSDHPTATSSSSAATSSSANTAA